MRKRLIISLVLLAWAATMPMPASLQGQPKHRAHFEEAPFFNKTLVAPIYFHKNYNPYHLQPSNYADYRDERFIKEENYLFSSYIQDTDATRYGYILKLANGTAFHIGSGGDFRDGTRVHVFLERVKDQRGGFGHYVVIHGVRYPSGRIY